LLTRHEVSDLHDNRVQLSLFANRCHLSEPPQTEPDTGDTLAEAGNPIARGVRRLRGLPGRPAFTDVPRGAIERSGRLTAAPEVGRLARAARPIGRRITAADGSRGFSKL